jgi:hypothetical protein
MSDVEVAMAKAAAGARTAAVLALAVAGVSGEARQFGFVPPSGYGGKGGPPLATPAQPGAPALTSLAPATISGLIHILPSYPGAGKSSVKVIGAYRITEPAGTRLVGAWAPGYLPVTVQLSDGRCFAFTADYAGPALSNAALRRVDCEERRPAAEPAPPTPPADHSLRLAGVAWGFAAWTDDRAGLTYITEPFAKTYQPLMTVRLPVTNIMAMNSPDAPLADMTLLTRINGQPALMTLEVSYGAFGK